MDGQPTRPKPPNAYWTSWLPQSVRDWLEWRRIARDLKSKGLPTDSPLRWLEWNRINAAGRDAYYRSAYAEADRLFEELLMITKELAPPSRYSILSGMKEASGWWQAEIVRQGVHDWNFWRQANPGIGPDLRGQNLSLEDPAPPYSPDYELQRPHWGIRDLSGINFASADLTSACLYFSDLSDADDSRRRRNLADEVRPAKTHPRGDAGPFRCRNS
jgi:hypothetical protein